MSILHSYCLFCGNQHHSILQILTIFYKNSHDSKLITKMILSKLLKERIIKRHEIMRGVCNYSIDVEVSFLQEICSSSLGLGTTYVLIHDLFLNDRPT